MKQVKGDLIKLAKEGEFDIIIHGCNCFNTMGAGIAKSIKQHFPEAYKTDCSTKKGDKGKLGFITKAWIEEYNLWIINAYTQYDYNISKRPINYKALEIAFININRMVEDLARINFKRKTDFKIGYPKIGAGLAGGDWDIIAPIIDKELEGLDHTLVIYEG